MTDMPIREAVREKPADRVIDRAAFVLLDALAIADALGDRYVGTEHLLMACEGRGGVSTNVLKSLGVYGKIVPEVARLLGQPANPPTAEPPGVEPPGEQPPASPARRPALFQAGEFTLRSGRRSAYKIECDAMTQADWAGVAAAWGCGGIRVVNLFAFRATAPNALLTAKDPIGPENDHYITGALVCCEPVVAAWGASVPAQYMYRPGHVLALAEKLRVRVTCLAETASGEPRHPLYLRANLTPVPLFPRRRTRS